MTTPNGPREERPDAMPGDLEARWEEMLHGRASPEEASAVKREIEDSGRRVEFDAQAEAYAAVRGHASRHMAPPGLHARLRGLAPEASAPAALRRSRFGWAAAGALAASLAIAIGFSLLR